MGHVANEVPNQDAQRKDKMPNQVCNSCGGFLNVQKCSHCPTLICDKCRVGHESVCAVNQQKRAQGLGPTIRNSKPDGAHSAGINVPEISIPQDEPNLQKLPVRRVLVDPRERVNLLEGDLRLPTTEQVEALQKLIKEAEAKGESLFQGPAIIAEQIADGHVVHETQANLAVGEEEKNESSRQPVLQSEQNSSESNIPQGSTLSPVSTEGADGTDSGQTETGGTDASGDHSESAATPQSSQDLIEVEKNLNDAVEAGSFPIKDGLTDVSSITSSDDVADTTSVSNDQPANQPVGTDGSEVSITGSNDDSGQTA